MAEQYLPILITFCLAGGIVAVMVSLGRLLGPSRPSAVKSAPFECGNPPTGTAWKRFSVKFYMTAILFIVFDVEVVFLYPWAVLYPHWHTDEHKGWVQALEAAGYTPAYLLIAMGFFFVLLLVGFFYEWRRGVFKWN
jgi:NADH-quinone oxidoreductase subunit A